MKDCNGNPAQYIEDTIRPLLKQYGFKLVLRGECRDVSLEIVITRRPDGGYTASGATAYVLYNAGFDWKLNKWTFDGNDKVWHMKMDTINSSCGYSGDRRTPLVQLINACKPASVSVRMMA